MPHTAHQTLCCSTAGGQRWCGAALALALLALHAGRCQALVKLCAESDGTEGVCAAADAALRTLATVQGAGIRLTLPDHTQYPRFASRRKVDTSVGRSVSVAAAGGGSVVLEVPAWPGGAPAALALTFDDGTPEQLAALTPLCASLNASCTLFLAASVAGGVDWASVDENVTDTNTAEHVRAAAVSAWAPSPGAVEALAAFRAAGNELGAHTLSHKDAWAEPPQPPWWSFSGDVDDFDDVLQRHLGVWPHEVRTFAYPFGGVCDAARDAGRGRYIAMRTTRCDVVDAGRDDWATQVRTSIACACLCAWQVL